MQSMAYKGLIATARSARTPWITPLWDRVWSLASSRLTGPVRIRLHGEEVVLNAGYAYPAFSRRWPTYNDPLVEVVHQASVAARRPVSLVDVGAAVGDTVLLVRDRAAGDVDAFHCVEGDPEFFGYLERNLGGRSDTTLHFAMLSDEPGEEAQLVRIHSGTASAQGSRRSPTTTLDLLLEGTGPVDVLKSDTDGFDGKVLAGATGILDEYQPAVIFEWHPLLYEATGQDWHRPFEVLTAHGYRWLVWFTKEGEFSHMDNGYEPTSTDALARVCLSGIGPRPDWHYDVVALPEATAISVSDLAGLGHARSRTMAGGVGRTSPGG